jgi:TusA-related sulfurtransferase
MSKAIIGIANTVSQAETIVTSLKNSGILTTDISVLMPDLGGNRDFAHEHNTKAPEGATIGGSAGGVAGGALGLLAGIGALAIPGVGPFIAAGPIMAALSGAAVGATIGGVAGALVGMGMPEYEAKQYEDKLKEGNILISVHTDDSDEAKRIKEIMEDAHAEDVSITGEAGVSKSDKAHHTSHRL